MLTRNKGVYSVGAYSENITDADAINLAAQRKFKSIINNINYFLIKNLKKKRKKSPIQRMAIEINEPFQKFLVDNYEIGHKFKVCNDILFDFKLETERFINLSSEASCKYFVKPGSFMIKLNRKSRLRYMAKEDHPKVIEKNPSITVRFISTFTSLTLSDEEFLSNYLND